MELSEPRILTPRQGSAAAGPGRSGGADDPFFAGVNGELADKIDICDNTDGKVYVITSLTVVGLFK